MSNPNDLRAHLAAQQTQKNEGNKLFLLLILLLPALGLGAGLAYNTLSSGTPPTPSAIASSTEATLGVDEQLARLSPADKWLIMKAKDKPGLAVALALKDQYRDIYRREVYKAVSSTLGLCATDYQNVKDFRFVSQNYRRDNKPTYLKIKQETAQSIGQEEFKKRIRQGAMAELRSGNFHKELHAAIEREMETFGQHVPNFGSRECQMVKTLAQRSLFNITS